MKEEVHSLFDEFETDEETGEVLVPRDMVEVKAEGAEKPEVEEALLEEAAVAVSENETESAVEEENVQEADDEELPELHFDFDFGEEELVTAEETETEEDAILKSIDDALAAQMAATLGPVETSEKDETKKKKKKNVWLRIPLWCRIVLIVLLSLCLLLGFFAGTKTGRSMVIKLVVGYMHDRMDVEENTPTPAATAAPTEAPTGEPENPDASVSATPTPVPTMAPRQEDYCYNVLLIGVEALPQLGSGGRSDTMILISINSRDKKIHMTSLMRDMYVQIPGHADDRLNAAYAKGGAELLVDTIELNFKVKIDGYVKVDFESFEWIVNRLGGVEITLTADEAEYLRTHNYISNPAYRNVVAGTQLMNGNQVLGYCRVRYVATANGTNSDFGRTERQRTVLNKIFNKYKNSNIFTMLDIFNDCLPRVTTNISKETMQNMLTMVVEEGILSLDTMRLPVSGGFSDVEVIIAGDRAKVLAVQWSKNIDALHEFIFGPEE
ncbi:MAG: LCP family protein [Lachnospiraceae bacterium]|nr:LCP family protein [Lachnospiraceae bacterium]